MKKNLIVILLLTIISNKMYSQKEMKDYEYSCYCTLHVPPDYIIKYENNWELLVALKDWKTLDDLSKLGIKYTQKQLEVLGAMNLIDKQDEKYKTLITISNAEETNEINAKTKEHAKKIVSIIQSDFTEFSKALKEQGFEKNTYTVFFSYIMDNIVWQKFESENILPKNEINAEKPFWDGTVWFNYPKRKFECGTNSNSIENLYAAINWSDISKLSLTDIIDYGAMLNDFKKNSKVTDTIIKGTLVQYGICDESGNFKVPFIKKDTTNTFNICCNHIADKIFNYLVKDVDFSTIEKKYNFQSKGDAIIVMYHNIMWDVLDVLVENGQIKKPNAFTHPDNSTLTDLRDLFFLYEN